MSSVEIDSHASRVVESHFPEVRQVSDVQSVDVNMVREWSREYSQASVVLIGGGPPCQRRQWVECGQARGRYVMSAPSCLCTSLVLQPW